MPVIRYDVTLPPHALIDATAFAPVPANTTARVSKPMAQGWTLHGQPGTERIPAPYADVGPSARPGSALPGGSGGGMAGGTRYAPPEWYPSEYWARQELCGGIGGVMVHTNISPGSHNNPAPSRPAADTRWVPGKYRRTWPWTGQRPIMADQPLPGWRWWRGSDAPLAQTGRRPTDG